MNSNQKLIHRDSHCYHHHYKYDFKQGTYKKEKEIESIISLGGSDLALN